MRKSRNEKSLKRRFKRRDTLKGKIRRGTFRRGIRKKNKKEEKILREENRKGGGGKA